MMIGEIVLNGPPASVRASCADPTSLTRESHRPAEVAVFVRGPSTGPDGRGPTALRCGSARSTRQRAAWVRPPGVPDRSNGRPGRSGAADVAGPAGLRDTGRSAMTLLRGCAGRWSMD